MKHGPHVLVILDGFGYRHAHDHNAIYHAHPKRFLTWLTQYPHTNIEASGVHVGLLPHMIGNSEVGHLTIGSGRRITQPVSEITESINDNSFFTNPLLVNRFEQLAHANKTLHLMGLLSDGGVHSYIYHLKALITLAAQKKITRVVVHPFLDGRDVAPQTAATYLTELEEALKQIPQGIIGSLHGRFYAMDRDNHWERTEESYRVLTTPTKPQFENWQQALVSSYDNGITDEFLKPITLHKEGTIKYDDAVVFFNFRADRARQLTRACIEDHFAPFANHPLNLSWMLTFTQYHPDFPVDVLLRKRTVNNTFFDVLERHNIPLFTIAETEKYAHVTYFFNGGREVVRQNETRILIPSKGQKETYASTPKMSAPEITDTVLQALDSNNHRFYLINYANADMVGHSGDFEATIKAINCLDEQLERLYTKVKELDGTLYITSDHGNAEDMWDIQLGQPKTAHTTNKVPFMLINNDTTLPIKELSDIAPFILKNLNLPVPPEMD